MHLGLSGLDGLRKSEGTAAALTPPVVADQTIYMGERTLVGAHGAELPVSTGGPVDDWTLITDDATNAGDIDWDASGSVVLAALVSGSYQQVVEASGPGGTVQATITIVTSGNDAAGRALGNALDAIDGAEIDDAATEYKSDAGTGDCYVRVRPGATIMGTNGTGSGLDWNTFSSINGTDQTASPTDYLIITSANPNNPYTFYDWCCKFVNSSKIHFDSGASTEPSGGTEESYSQDALFNARSPCNTLKQTNWTYTARNHDPDGDYSAGYSSPIAIESRDCHSWHLENITFRGGFLFLGTVMCNGVFTALNLNYESAYGDFIRFVMPTAATHIAGAKLIKNISGGVFFGDYDDDGEPHLDIIQTFCVPVGQGTISNLRIENVNGFTGAARTYTLNSLTQGMQTEDPFINLLIINCSLACNNTNGMRLDSCTSAVLQSCQVLNYDASQIHEKPQIRFTDTGSGVHTVRDCITASGISLGDGADLVAENNIVVDLEGSQGHTSEDIFNDPLSLPNTPAEAINAYKVKAGGYADLNGIGTFDTDGNFRAGPWPPAAAEAPTLT